MSWLRTVAGLMAAGALGLGCGGERFDCNCPATPPRGCVYTGRQACACSAMVCSDAGPAIDVGAPTIDTGTDVGTDAGTDVGIDAAIDLGGAPDVGDDARVDVAGDIGSDAADAQRRDVVGDERVEVCDLSMAPGLDRSCSTNAQCRVGVFTQNCCGSGRAVGFNAASAMAFDAFRQVCDRVFGGPRMCGCPTLPPVLDDGRSAPDEARIRVSCEMGVCRTFLER